MDVNFIIINLSFPNIFKEYLEHMINVCIFDTSLVI